MVSISDSLDERREQFCIAATSLKFGGGGFLFTQEAEDEKYMRRALELARRGIGHTRPNPIVGAVLVKRGRIIGEGWHEQYGGPHAEVNAFASCREDPDGATLYVTLEPCAHYGKTPPCADLIIRKKVGRVVTSMVDPNPLVAGKGIQKIRKAGIPVTVGVLADECRLANEIFLKFVTQRKPFVLYKAAMSLDGKTACASGESQWISCEASREETHRLRGEYAGILTGIGTILSDDPRLTARIEGMSDPCRIICDSRLRIPLTSKVLHEPGKTVILTTSAASEKKQSELHAFGADILICDGADGKVDLSLGMTGLAALGIDSVLIEGGGTIADAALRAGIVDKIIFYTAPMLIGGAKAPSPVSGVGAGSLKEAVRLKHVHVEPSGIDLKITAYIDKEAPCSQASSKK